jgi:hypothetical protein
LRWVAATRIREVFTALALLTVIGTALLMEAVGLSMALGAFLAGVLLADSEYRHALEADLEPFKGLLLGLFFIAVGMSVDLGLAIERPVQVLGLALGLVAVKFAALFLVGRISGYRSSPSLRLAASIAQGGEFAFVIFGVAVANRVIEAELADLLILVVTLSMALTPLVDRVVERWLSRKHDGPVREFDTPPADGANPVIIAGFGRFGQIVGRILRAKRIGFTALDASPLPASEDPCAREKSQACLPAHGHGYRQLPPRDLGREPRSGPARPREPGSSAQAGCPPREDLP